jgi:hypothetical protein
MTLLINHTFVSAKSDGVDSTLVQPSAWNAPLSTSMSTGKVLGRTTSGVGPIEELTDLALTSLAIGGASLGGNALAVTGTAAFSGDIFALGATFTTGGVAIGGGGLSCSGVASFSGGMTSNTLALGGVSLGGNNFSMNGSANIGTNLVLGGLLTVNGSGPSTFATVTATVGGVNTTAFGNIVNWNSSGATYSNSSGFEINNGSGNGVFLFNNGTVWNSTSDETAKDGFEAITDALDKVNTLRAITGYYKSDETKMRHPFLIAQDVQKILPEAVGERNGLLSLGYTDMIPLMVAAIKELTARLAAAEARIDALGAA